MWAVFILLALLYFAAWAVPPLLFARGYRTLGIALAALLVFVVVIPPLVAYLAYDPAPGPLAEDNVSRGAVAGFVLAVSLFFADLVAFISIGFAFHRRT